MSDSITLTGQTNGTVNLTGDSGGTLNISKTESVLIFQGASQGIKGDKGDQGDPATNLVTSVAGKQGVVVLTKSDVGLGNVQNLAPADMPVSTAQQTAIDGKQDSDATLTALAAHNTNGLLTQTAADTFTGRTITGTTNQITVTNGDGVAGNPTLSLPNAITLPGTLTITGHTSPQADSTYTLGTSSLYWKETYTDKLFLNSTATLDGSTAGEIKGTGIFTADNIKRGTGFPEGVVTANVGTVYIDTAITNGASSWIKKSGTGNTGWQVLEGDTGWRQMKADWNVSPRSSGNGFVERLLIRRVGNRITLACYLEAAFGGGKDHSVAAFLPVGFRNTSSLGGWPFVNRFRLTSSQTTWVDPILETGTAGNLRIITPSPTHEAYSEIAWVTDNQWPTTLPGTAA